MGKVTATSTVQPVARLLSSRSPNSAEIVGEFRPGPEVSHTLLGRYRVSRLFLHIPGNVNCLGTSIAESRGE